MTVVTVMVMWSGVGVEVMVEDGTAPKKLRKFAWEEGERGAEAKTLP